MSIEKLAVIVSPFILLLFLTYLFYTYSFNYWKRRNIFSPPKNSFIMGHFSLSGDPLVIKYANFYSEYKSHKYIGLNLSAVNLLLVNDLDLVKNVMTKDYAYFEGHGMKAHKDVDPLAQNLFNLEGEEWKRIRVKLTPTFTTSKMKFMFDTLLTCNREMVEYLKTEIKIDNVIEFKEVTAKLGTNVIANCAFGLESNCFKDPDSEFRKIGKDFFDLNIFQTLFYFLAMFAPKISEMSRQRLVKKRIEDFMMNVIADAIEYRDKNNVKRNDYLQLLIDLKNTESKSEMPLSMKEIASQAFVFFIAGFETSSTAAHYTLLELAKHPEIRDELTRKIDEAIEENNNEITYELLQKIPYLDKVIDESMRMYPPVPVLSRRCTKDYKIPGTKTIIEKGTGIAIPVYGIHNDPDIFPEPHKFKPERFNAEMKKNYHPYSYIPFGEGPRNCIGSRFGLMQLKLALIYILKYFHIEKCPKTISNVKFNKRSILLHSEDGIYLKVTERRL